MKQGGSLKRIRIWILRYLQFRRLVWFAVAGFVGSFFLDPNNSLYWWIVAILLNSAAALFLYAICPVCQKPVHSKAEARSDYLGRMDAALETIGRKSCVHCGYSFNKIKRREPE